MGIDPPNAGDLAARAAPPAGSGGRVVGLDGDLLFSGDYTRGGGDLHISGGDGRQLTIEGYFTTPSPATLVSAGGAELSGALVERLAGSSAPVRLAQAGTPQLSAAPAIGQVETIAGAVTATSPNGATVALKVGDHVILGDIIATGPGASVGITFTDRSVISIADGARIVLDQYVYAPAGTSNSMLFNVVQGLFSFVSGQIARTGDMRIDSPVATMGIRGTTGVAQIEAVAGTTIFTLVNDPDGRVGSFSLFNKTTGALIKTFTQPSETLLVRSAIGDAADINKTLDQLAADQRGVALVFSAFSVGQGRLQRGEDPVDLTPQPGGLQRRGGLDDPIQFALRPDGLGGEQIGLLPNITFEEKHASLGETIFNMPREELKGSPTLVLPAAPTVVEDTPIKIEGIRVADPEGDILFVTIVAKSTVTLVTTAGLDFISGDGFADSFMQFTGLPERIQAALDGLLYAPTPDSELTGGLTITITDGTFTVLGSLVIQIEPVNDAAVIAGDTTGAVTEDGAHLAVSGQLSVTDVDGDDTFQAQTDAAGDNDLGTFSISAGGAWTFTLDNGDSRVDALNTDSAPLTETFTVRAADGTAQVITITIHGSNDAAVIAGDTAGTITEDGAHLAVSGQLSVTDVDGDDAFQAQTDAAGDNDLGTFSISAGGAWTFTLDNGDPRVDALNSDSAPLTETFTVRAADGTAQVITITIAGANDAPTAQPISTVVLENAAPAAIDLLAQASARDVDGPHALEVLDPAGRITSSDGRQLHIGTHYTVNGAQFALTAAGLALFNTLGDDDSDRLTFTYRIGDGLASVANTLEITLRGQDDGKPTILAASSRVAEAGLEGPPAGTNAAADSESTAGTISIAAPDGLAVLTVAGLALTPADLALLAGAPTSPIDTGTGFLTLTGYQDNGSGTGGVLSWRYELADAESHAPGGTGLVTDLIAIEVRDGDGQVAAGTLAVAIEDDAPIAHDDVATASMQGSVNLVLIIDVSGSMDGATGVAGFQTRLDLAKAALTQLVSTADLNEVLIVSFSSGAQSHGWLGDAQSALAVIAALEAGGGTNYDAALAATMSAYTANRPDAAAATYVYFLSDGAPTQPNGSVGISASEQQAWEAFLTNPTNAIDGAFAVGIGSGVGLAALQPVAFPNGDAQNPVVLVDESELASTLAGLLSRASGNVLTDGIADQLGADGGTLHSITVTAGEGSHTFTLDADGAGVFLDGDLIADGSVFTATTGLGGRLTFDLASGDWSYAAPREVDGYTDDTFVYSLIDGDGDLAEAKLTIHLYPTHETLLGTLAGEMLNGDADANLILGQGGNDVVAGNGGFDALLGGAGDDRLSIADSAFNEVDGGTGIDTLALDGGGFTLDLTQIADGALRSLERIDLAGPGDHTLAISLDDVISLSETVDPALLVAALASGIAISGTESTVVAASAGDAVTLIALADSAGAWSAAGSTSLEGAAYDVYNFVSGGQILGTVAVDHDATVT